MPQRSDDKLVALRECAMTADAANRGIIRPPLVYLGSIAAALIIDLISPIAVREAGINAGLVVAMLLGGMILFLLAVRTLQAARTPVPGSKPTTTIVRAGPYRFSRNPIYLSFSLFQLGLALWLNSLWMVIALLASIAVMSFVVIPREERYLASRFPSEYAAYKNAVRRWL